MKLRLLFCCLFCCCCAVFAQTASPAQPSETQQFSPKAATFSGRVSDDARFFVADPDSQVWTVANPELLKSHQGQHVQLQGQTAAGTKSIRVLSARPSESDVRYVARQSDSAFRR